MAAIVKFDVVVIGAGAAGLAAARFLNEKGRTVAIVEAKRRIGGRVWTAYPWRDDLPVEWGAEFIHDCDAADTLWPIKDWPRTKAYWKGSIGRNSEFRYRFGDRWVTAREESGRMRRAMGDPERIVGFKPRGSVRDVIERWSREKALEKKVAIAEIEAVYAADPAQLSAESVVLEAREWGRYRGDYRLAGPYATVIRDLAESVQIHLGDPVKRIIQHAGSARIITRGGCEYRAVRVIVTIPLAVLRTEAVEFEPRLSERKREAIEKLGMGNVVKVAVRAKPFWGRLQYAASDSPVPSWWPAGRAGQGGAVLMGWAGGESANRLSRLSRRDTLEQIRRSLRTLFPGCPRMADDEIKFVDWSKDEFSLGAYSYVPPGAEDCRKILAEPEAGCLYFAGEATHERFPMTVTGAVLSGRRAAQAVLTTLR